MADPMMAQMVSELKILQQRRAADTGTSSGMRDMYGWLTAGLLGLATVASILYAVLR